MPIIGVAGNKISRERYIVSTKSAKKQKAYYRRKKIEAKKKANDELILEELKERGLV